MKDNVLVSVLVPIYNTERYLRQCLDSLAAQTLTKMEIICLDDGSTDSSSGIVDEYVEHDARFRALHKENSGYGDTLNRGLAMASGEYIGIVESDDFVEPDMFESLYSLAVENDCEISRGNRFDFYEGCDTYMEILKGCDYGKVFSPLQNQRIFKPAPCIWAQIYRRSFIEDNGIRFLPTPGAAYQDTGFVYKSYIAADRIILTPDAHVHYRKDNPESSVKSSSKVFNIIDEFHSIDDYLNAQLERRDFLAPALAAERFRAYWWNQKRLSRKDKREFLVAAAADFHSIDQEVWSEVPLSSRNRRRLRKWMEDPEGLWLDIEIESSHMPGKLAWCARRMGRKVKGRG